MARFEQFSAHSKVPDGHRQPPRVIVDRCAAGAPQEELDLKLCQNLFGYFAEGPHLRSAQLYGPKGWAGEGQMKPRTDRSAPEIHAALRR